MRLWVKRLVCVLFIALCPALTLAEDIMIETFEDQPETRWRFFTDGVMGGMSTGQAMFLRERDGAFMRLTGSVSTDNNGGFIQVRMALPEAAPSASRGVRLVVRGNAQRYFIHLRTKGTRLPWQYYQSGFDAVRDWTEVRLPFDTFEPSGALLGATPRADSLKSIGIVAFGRDHQAALDVREIGFY